MGSSSNAAKEWMIPAMIDDAVDVRMLHQHFVAEHGDGIPVGDVRGVHGHAACTALREL